MAAELLVWAAFPPSVVARIVVASTILWGMTSDQVSLAGTIQLTLLAAMTLNVHSLFSYALHVKEDGCAILYRGGGILGIIFVACEMILLILLGWGYGPVPEEWPAWVFAVLVIPGLALSMRELHERMNPNKQESTLLV